jgi:hypothetical protein
MKLSLRELFLAPGALDPGSNPLIRLGALHHLHRTAERDQIRGKLEILLAEQRNVQQSDAGSTLFPLHVAVALAQEGGLEGIEWLLRYLADCDQRNERLGFTALRNCRQFPLAVLLGCTTTARSIETSHRLLGGLSSFSDDHAWILATKGSPAESVATMSALEVGLQQVQGTIRADRRLSVGTIISRPLRKPLTGVRFTGFLVVEEGRRRWRAIPYQMADLINRDDGSARETASDLLRNAGRRVLVAYDLGENNEAQAVYALPFAPLLDVSSFLPEIALQCEGLTVGVIVHKWESKAGERYRVVTASGQTNVDLDRSGRLQVGECVFTHISSSRPFFSHLRIARPDVERVVAKFVRSTSLERSVLLRSWKNGYSLGGQSGRVVVFRDEVPEEPVVLLEDQVIREVSHTFPVKLPYSLWAPEDRSAVLDQFFTKRRECYAVVVGILDPSGNAPRALIVNPNACLRELRPTNLRDTGMPVYWEVGDGDKIYTTILTDQCVNAKCRICFDTNYRVCEACDGRGRTTCSQCAGTGKSECGHCGGSGERRFDCRACSGTGNCGNCHGAGKINLSCKICEGRGTYADSGRTCKKCGGQGSFQVPCRVCAQGSAGQCPKCKGRGDEHQACKTCGTTGRWNCSRCRTTGISSCDTCEGALFSACGCGGTGTIRLRPLTGGA